MKGLGETQTGFRVGGVTNIAKKKNVFRETLKLLLKKWVSGVLKIAPTVSGSKKTKDHVCSRGFSLVDFKGKIDANM